MKHDRRLETRKPGAGFDDENRRPTLDGLTSPRLRAGGRGGFGGWGPRIG